MISIKIDPREFQRKLNRSISYSQGFVDGINMQKITFMRFLGGFTAEALGKYIDSMARTNPERLHHVYEPNMVGNEGGRLFSFNVIATANTITFQGKFLPSKRPSSSSREPFRDKANIMENRIAIDVEPKEASALVFEDGGETIFVNTAITIEHPGGDAVANAFGQTVNSFFEEYFVSAFLAPLLKDLSTAEEFLAGFNTGGRPAGVRAGRQYLKASGLGAIG